MDRYETNSPPNSPDRNIQTRVIPVGPRFQADLPALTGSIDYSPQLLGTKVWPVEGKKFRQSKHVNKIAIGGGRPDSCPCENPGSTECIELHVGEERKRLQKELGPAFKDWKFHEMGEGASKNWTSTEIKMLELLVKRSTSRKGGDFLNSALKALSHQNRETIIRYYFNIIVPKRIGSNIRAGYLPSEINTDDETGASSSSSSRVRKRSQAQSGRESKRFLTGFR